MGWADLRSQLVFVPIGIVVNFGLSLLLAQRLGPSRDRIRNLYLLARLLGGRNGTGCPADTEGAGHVTHGECDSPPLVLTATIVPNGDLGVHADWRARRQEYLSALDFYPASAGLFPGEFELRRTSTTRTFCATASPSASFRHRQTLPSARAFWNSNCSTDGSNRNRASARWIKVTGRYRYANIRGVLEEWPRRYWLAHDCRSVSTHAPGAYRNLLH